VPIVFPDLSGRTILLVDDNDDHLDLLLAFFHACQGHVLMARNVQTALVYLADANVDLLVSDLAMPGEDGIALIKALRSFKGERRRIPAIAVTGFEEQYLKARSQGFDAFLQKPINPETLASVVGKFFAPPSQS
jgi:CheY-like chemotaxis protein